MWFAVYAVCHGKTAVPDIEPLGTWLSVCACFVCARCDLSHLCVFIRPGQTALNHCRSQRQRKTLMLSHSDTYLTPLSWTLTVLRADVCVLVCRAVTSHQTAAPRPWPTASSLPLQSYFPLPLFHFAVFVSAVPQQYWYQFNVEGSGCRIVSLHETCWSCALQVHQNKPVQTHPQHPPV